MILSIGYQLSAFMIMQKRQVQMWHANYQNACYEAKMRQHGATTTTITTTTAVATATW